MTAEFRIRCRPPRPGRPLFRPRLTALEDRWVPSFGWVAAGGSAAAGVATDAAGDVYTVGSFATSFTPTGSSVPLTSAGAGDIFVTKYDRSGAFLWAVNLGSLQDDAGSGIAVDSTGGNVYVVGHSAGGGYVADLDAATGVVRWAQTVAGSDAWAVAADAAGSAYVLMSSAVVKFDPAGAQQWQATMSGAAPTSIAAAGGNVYVGGTYGPTATFTTASGTNTITGSSYFCGFVLNLTSSNTFVWARTFQGTLKGSKVNGFLPTGVEVAADGSGNVYAAGNFLGTVNFGNSNAGTGPFVLTGSGNGDGSAFVTKLGPAGNVAWAKKFGDCSSRDGTNGAAVYAIAVDAAGAVYLTGYFGRTTSFNPAGGGTLTSNGTQDLFVSKLSASGAFQWAVRAGSAGGDQGAAAIAVNGFGDVYVAGSIFSGPADFDPASMYFDDRDLLTTATGFLWQIRQP